MLLAERARAERRQQIIKELQRHRFGHGPRRCQKINCCSASKKSSRRRRALRPRTKRRRQPSGQATPPSAASTVDRCRRICRASRWWSTSTIMPARAAKTGWCRRPAPARLIEGGLPTEATVAQVLVAKYADHLPLYRQAQIMCCRASRSIARPWPWGLRRRLPAAAGARASARQVKDFGQAVR